MQLLCLLILDSGLELQVVECCVSDDGGIGYVGS